MNEAKQKELLERLKKFATTCLMAVKGLPKTDENKIYGHQLIRSSSSIGANYAEATCAFTTPDFLHDLNKSRKESKESTYWIDLLIRANPTYKENLKDVLNEGEQICKIFSSSVKTMRQKVKS